MNTNVERSRRLQISAYLDKMFNNEGQGLANKALLANGRKKAVCHRVKSIHQA